MLLVHSGAMAASFYRINERGQSINDDPIASGFALSDTDIEDSLADDVTYHVPEKAEVSAPTSPRPIIINKYIVVQAEEQAPRETRSRRAVYSFARSRCESYGFIYSSDGKCRVPAWAKVRRRHDSNKRGLRHGAHKVRAGRSNQSARRRFPAPRAAKPGTRRYQ